MRKLLPRGKKEKKIVKIIETLDRFIEDKPVKKRGRSKKYSDRTIVKLVILLKLSNVSYRGTRNFLEGNPWYMELVELEVIPPFWTIARRAKELREEIERLNEKIANLFLDTEGLERNEVAVDSFCSENLQGLHGYETKKER